MIPRIQEMNYSPVENPSSFGPNIENFIENNLQAFQLDRFLTNLQNNPFILPVHEVTPNLSYISNSSTSDEADDNHHRVIDERKQRRMISNRESARRSRMRKQKHFDELWSQVLRLRTENQNLTDKLNHVSEHHFRALQENARLKEETSELREMLTDVQLSDSYSTILRDLVEEIPCNIAYLRN